MRSYCMLSTFLVLLGLAATPAQDDAVKKELAKLQGTWQVLSAEENKENNEKLAQSLKLVFKGDRVTLKGLENIDKKAASIKIVIDPTTTPKTIDFKIEAGSEKGTTPEGIYEIKDDELRICVHTPGGSRPTEFATRPGSNLVLFVLKREKD